MSTYTKQVLLELTALSTIIILFTALLFVG